MNRSFVQASSLRILSILIFIWQVWHSFHWQHNVMIWLTLAVSSTKQGSLCTCVCSRVHTCVCMCAEMLTFLANKLGVKSPLLFFISRLFGTNGEGSFFFLSIPLKSSEVWKKSNDFFESISFPIIRTNIEKCPAASCTIILRLLSWPI